MSTKQQTKPTRIDPMTEVGYATVSRAKLRQMLNYLTDESVDRQREKRRIETIAAQLEEWLK